MTVTPGSDLLGTPREIESRDVKLRPLSPCTSHCAVTVTLRAQKGRSGVTGTEARSVVAVRRDDVD